MRWLCSTFVAASTLAAGARAAELKVVSVDPARNTMSAPGTAITIVFDRALDTTTITPSTFRVLGKRSGPTSGSFSFSNGNKTVVFTPVTTFAAGELVQVNLAHDIKAADASALRAAGYSHQFGTHTQPTLRRFQEIAVMSNRTGGAQTRIYGAQAMDLDNDGYVDLATVNEVSADVRVTLNRADGSGRYGSFLVPVPIGVEASPNDAADFDNDGNGDMCIGASSSNSVWVLLGHGDGTFDSVQSIAVGGEPHGVVAIDVDGDGDQDIVNANNGNNNLSLMLNNGSGGFGAATFFEGGVNGEYGLAAADMNNDGITDLVVGGRDGEEIVTLLGNGNKTFTASGPAQDSGGQTWVVVVDDLNGDGNLDATTANSFSNNGAVLIGNGNGRFNAPVLMDVGAHTVSTDLGDMDGDGDVDWVLSSFGGGFWRLYLNDGAGHFTFDQEFTAPSNPSCSVLLDFDNDGDLDMALTDEIADVILLMRNETRMAFVNRRFK